MDYNEEYLFMSMIFYRKHIIKKINLIVVTFFSVLAFVGCSEDTDGDEFTTESTATISINEIGESSLPEEEQSRLLELANYIIFDKGDTKPNTIVRKWDSAINIYLTGTYTSEEAAAVDDFIAELNALNVYNLHLDRVDNLEDSNVEIWFSSVHELINDRPDFQTLVDNPSTSFIGVSRPFFGSVTGEIFEGNIWIESGADDSFGTIKHEITHMLGLDHSNDVESLMYPKNVRGKNLTSDDIFVTEVLYSKFIESGFNEEEVEEALKAYFQTI